MANKTTPMSTIKQVLILRKQQASQRSIAQQLHINRRTVQKFLALAASSGRTDEDLLAMNDNDLENLLLPNHPNPDLREHKQILEKLFPEVLKGLQKEHGKGKRTRWNIWAKYKNEYPEGVEYPTFCKRFAQWRKPLQGHLPQEHIPGDKLFCDFAGKKLHIVDRNTGELQDVEMFVCALGASNRTYLEAVQSQQRPDTLIALENSLHYFGGVPRAIVPDNMKSLVDKASRYEPRVNEEAEAFANHYNTVILPTRPGKPKDKPKVEGAVKISYMWIYAELDNRTFFSIKELNAAIREELMKFDARKMQAYGQNRLERFAETDQPALQPLPAERFAIRRIAKVTVMMNGHVQLREDKHYYSVPFRFIGKTCKLVYNSNEVEVYFGGERIAAHPRVRKPHGYTWIKDHLASHHQFVTEWSKDKFLEWGNNISSEIRDYMEQLFLIAKHPEMAYKSCMGILSLARRYGRDRLIAAIGRATFFYSFSYGKVLYILEKNLDRIEYESPTLFSNLPSHDNIRGEDYYK